MKTEADGIQAFRELMLKHTVRLIRNIHTFPKDSGVASGVILERDDGLLLLTAGHIFDRPGSWTLETSLSVGNTTLHARFAILSCWPPSTWQPAQAGPLTSPGAGLILQT